MPSLICLHYFEGAVTAGGRCDVDITCHLPLILGAAKYKDQDIIAAKSTLQLHSFVCGSYKSS